MLLNYLKLTLRHLRRQPGYTVINLTGLAVGLATCILLLLFVRDEYSYDEFHEHADRVYRVVRAQERLYTSAALAPALERDFPEVVRAIRLSRRWSEVLVTHLGDSFYEDRFFFTDPAFFDVFSFPLLQGNPDSALTRPLTVVLSESMAHKYFGEENPVGQTINLKGPWEAHDFEITGVVQDAPHNSHFTFNFLASFATRFVDEPTPENVLNWRHVGDLTYVLLAEGAAIDALQAQMPAFYLRYQEPRGQPNLEEIYGFQPLTAIHLHSHLENELEPNAEERYLYIFSVVALLTLLIGGINYMNLATARSAHRAREVGVRKVVGAQRRQLVYQFLGESVLMVLLALAFALILVDLCLPLFNNLTEKRLTLSYLQDGDLLVALLIAGLGLGLLAGSYPALFLSRFRPVRVLKGLVTSGKSNARFRNGLVITQFAVSVTLIIGTLAVQRQLDYMKEKRLGLNPDQVLVLNTRNALGSTYQNFGPFKEELLRHANVDRVTALSPVFPARIDDLQSLYPFDPINVENPPAARLASVGIDFLETLDISLVRGRTLRPEDLERVRSREATPVLINEAAMQAFGWEEPIGKEFACCLAPTPVVVGVVEDFHYQSLKEEIATLVLVPTWWARNVLVRVRTADLGATLSYLERQWNAFAPGKPFDYTFMDEHFARAYDTEERLAQLFRVFSFLAIFIACLGLVGLAMFAIEQRTKEIGIRKVLGASVSGIVVLLSKDFLRLVALAVVLSAPVAYLATERWLQDFPYRLPLTAWPFLLAGLAALLIALMAVGYQSIKAALAHPVDSLRHE